MLSRSFLIVEDNPMVAKALTRMLQPLGVSTVTQSVEAGVRALATAKEWTALFLDVTLPDGSGLTVLERARDIQPKVPALVMTGHATPANINGAFDLGASYICKPIAGERVTAFVQQCGRMSESARARRATVIETWRKKYELTPTENEILRGAVEGATREQIQASRAMAKGTMKKHVQNLVQKTGDPSLLAAVQRALREAM